jgi:YD repeat-containing protein
MIGVTKVTDPTQSKSTYEYDAYGRLLLVRDTKNAIVGQNKYHLKARTSSKILAISGDLNFGTLTPDMYASQTIYYARCSDAMLAKTMTLTNSGDDDLTVSSIQLPTGFIASWNSGIILAGTSVDVIITFDGTKPLGTYSGTITINSDKTAGPSTTTVSAVYATRANVIGNPTLVNFGTVSPVGFQNITITNTGNAPLRLAYVAYNWNGVLPVPTANQTNAYFTIPISNQCFGGTAFSNSMTVQSTFTPQFSGTVSATVSLFFDDGTYKQNAFTIQGTKN